MSVWQRPGEMPHHVDLTSFSMTMLIVLRNLIIHDNHELNNCSITFWGISCSPSCLFPSLFVLFSDLKAPNQSKKWQSRSKLSKSKKNPKKSRRLWTRYSSRMSTFRYVVIVDRLFSVFGYAQLQTSAAPAFHRVHPSTPSQYWRKVTR